MSNIRKKIKKSTVIFFITTFLLQFITTQGVTPVSSPEAKASTLSNPRISDGVTKWDCVYFGKYAQSDATGKTKEPIKWRVLSVDGNDVFLLADKNLDVKRYHSTNADITWDKSKIRSWLNKKSGNSFLNTAFTTSEKNAIIDTPIVNNGNLLSGRNSGKDTVDKIYLLSKEDVLNPAYGFTNKEGSTKTREAKNTAFVARNPHMWGEDSPGYWWLRSPGNFNLCTALVENYGDINSPGYEVYELSAVRPALHLNLGFYKSWKYAGTISSESKGNNPKGKLYTSEEVKYKITKSTKKTGEVSVSGLNSKKIKKLVIPEKVRINRFTFNVTSVATNALKNCKNLKSIQINTKKLKKVEKNALQGIHRKCIIKVPEEKLKKYKKLLKGAGQRKTVEVTAIKQKSVVYYGLN